MSFPRYPKYKASGVEWLGDVPEHWETAQLRHFVDIENGTDHKHVEQSEGFPVYGSGGVFAYASDFLYDGESVLLGSAWPKTDKTTTNQRVIIIANK